MYLIHIVAFLLIVSLLLGIGKFASETYIHEVHKVK